MIADIVVFSLGATLFLFAEARINRMSKATRKCIRFCFTMLALGGFWLAAGVVMNSPLLISMAIGAAVFGSAVLIIRNARHGNIFGCRESDAFWRKDHGQSQD